jgi:hypothetical protein
VFHLTTPNAGPRVRLTDVIELEESVSHANDEPVTRVLPMLASGNLSQLVPVRNELATCRGVRQRLATVEKAGNAGNCWQCWKLLAMLEIAGNAGNCWQCWKKTGCAVSSVSSISRAVKTGTACHLQMCRCTEFTISACGSASDRTWSASGCSLLAQYGAIWQPAAPHGNVWLRMQSTLGRRPRALCVFALRAQCNQLRLFFFARFFPCRFLVLG